MKKVHHIETISEYNSIAQHETFHPLVSFIDFSTIKPENNRENAGIQALIFGFYAVFLKQGKHCTIRYGRNKYDYQEGTLVFIAPGQVTSIEEDGEDYQPEGYAILFHPDLIHGTSLGQRIKEYAFFSYHVNEALHLSERERQIVLDSFQKIEYEIKHAIDKYSKRLIVSNIELFLDYCIRFYNRQFITRENANQGVLAKFETLLNDYFRSDKPQILGPPMVNYFADQLNLSPGYFGELIRKETGKSAQERIQLEIIELAKEKIFDPNKTIAEVAYELGFKYPQHFTRMFKKSVGISPNEFRIMN